MSTSDLLEPNPLDIERDGSFLFTADVPLEFTADIPVFDDSGLGEWLKAEQEAAQHTQPLRGFQTAWTAATALDAQLIQSQ